MNMANQNLFARRGAEAAEKSEHKKNQRQFRETADFALLLMILITPGYALQHVLHASL